MKISRLKPAMQGLVPREKRDTLLDFVPAALEIEKSPPNPLGLWLINSICLLFIIAILWAVFGKMDIIAVAEGTVVPDGQVKTIQANELSVVNTIHVVEGSQVRKGDPLVTLDATVASADLERTSQELKRLRARLAREQTFSEFLPQIAIGSPLTTEQARDSLAQKLREAGAGELAGFQQHLLRGYFSDYQTESGLIEQQKTSKLQELAMSHSRLRKAEKTLPILTERTGSLKTLLKRNLVARNQYLELEAERIDAEETLALERSRIKQIQSQLDELDWQQTARRDEALYKSLSQQEELARNIAALEEDYEKAELRSRQQVIRAPIDGTVQELAIHTQGAVLQPAQALMQIVPAGSILEVQAWVLNQDIGFVEEGQPVTVKISTYNFTKYGTVTGTLVNLSEDAVLDEKKGYRYLSKVDLDTQSLNLPDKQLALRPGMDVIAEVKTGKRHIYEYVTKPIRESLGNSFGER